MADTKPIVGERPVKPILAVITARGGSKGLPMKNTRPLAGIPLIAHSILCAKMCSGIDRLVVSTDSAEIADVARAYGADVPFMRPPELALDDTPTWPVLRHAMMEMEAADRRTYNSLLLLDPTSPGRLPGDIAKAIEMLEGDHCAEGVIAVSQPDFNPVWTAVVTDKDGYMRSLVDGGDRLTHRQHAPTVYRINATLYLVRREVAYTEHKVWREYALRPLVTDPDRSLHIDTERDLTVADALIAAGLITFPWLAEVAR